jgi:alpha-N-arabinofuranosidase
LEDNHFGTHEFINFCRLVGAEPYLAGNLGSGSVREMRNWVEYCNFDRASSLAKMRGTNGSPAPFGVRYWGVGNEAWGCGGNFCPEDYAKEYRRYATYLRDFGGTELFLMACGPDGNKTEWTRKFLGKLAGADKRFNCRIHGLGAHYYCGTAGTATEYTTDQWYELLERAAGVETLILDQRGAMDEFDPERRIGLAVDEWGTWHPPTPGKNPAHLWQQNTVRDGVVAAITLDAFNRQADKVVMANLAQAANVLQALFLTEGERMVLTPTYHVFELYRGHQGGKAVTVEVEGPSVKFARGEERGEMGAVAGSASVKGRVVTVTLTNAHARGAVEVELGVRGAEVKSAEGVVVAGEGIHSFNTFEEPNIVGPRRAEGEGMRWVLPAGSVGRVEMRI